MTTTTPETYELPPEPPIGSRVRDHSGREWVRDASIGWKSEDESRMTVVGWALLMGHHGPLVRIPDPEPDPWPTVPLIVATLRSPSRSTKRLLLARNSNGDYVDGVRSALQEIDTLTNAVPVAVVPVAELDALREDVRTWDEGGFAPLSTSARNLIAATDALGLDQ